MAGMFRTGIVRFLNRSTGSKLILNTNTPAAVVPACNISGKTMRGFKLVRPKPFPYKEKEYGYVNMVMDKTTYRFDENSKIIVVEGSVAAGKKAFAKELAEELEMLYVPDPTMDDMYINSYGYDLRKLDPLLTEACKSYDVYNFLENPHHASAACYQIFMLQLRYGKYIDALAHLMSTGQGVVLTRSPYSDIVFLEAMVKHNYVSKGAQSVYREIVQNSIPELMMPHLVVYLDVPVNIIKDRIKKRNNPKEVNSKVLTTEYLTDLEVNYKQKYLKDISQHSELLVYDWSDYGETEVVVEDIERMDFDKYNKFDYKLSDWNLASEHKWSEKRALYCNDKAGLLQNFHVPRFDVPELLLQPEDEKVLDYYMTRAPGMAYKKGYNADMGDTGIRSKLKTDLRDSL